VNRPHGPEKRKRDQPKGPQKQNGVQNGTGRSSLEAVADKGKKRENIRCSELIYFTKMKYGVVVKIDDLI
jgi:hypothetical protein